MAKKNVRDEPPKTQVTENAQLSDIVFILDKMEEAPLDQGKIRSLPGITVYIVQPEDTLWDIAKRFYTTTEEIRSMNELENEEISSGMPLLLVKKVEE